MIDETARHALRDELDPGESLIWAGRPSPLRYALRRGWVPTLMAFPWLAFLAFWFTGFTGGFSPEGFDFSDGFGIIGVIFGSLFLFAGLGMLLTIPREYLTARSTAYGLTSTRGVIRSGVVRKTVTTLSPETLGVLVRRGESHGSLLVENPERRAQGGFAIPGWSSWEERGFLDIADPRSVERLIRTQVRARYTSTGPGNVLPARQAGTRLLWFLRHPASGPQFAGGRRRREGGNANALDRDHRRLGHAGERMGPCAGGDDAA